MSDEIKPCPEKGCLLGNGHQSDHRFNYVTELKKRISALEKERDLAREMLIADKTHVPCGEFEKNQKKKIEALEAENETLRWTLEELVETRFLRSKDSAENLARKALSRGGENG